MTTKLIVGLDGSEPGERALAHAKKLSTLIGDCAIEVVYIIEWSPYSFQTPEENAKRHKRREQEIKTATERVISPALSALKSEGYTATGRVLHGDAAELLDSEAVKEKAEQIIVARSTDTRLAAKLFGSVTAKLVMNASVPVTVVN
ncbi:universal stress protein [Aestuariirhabdus sp. Z084]|uniref:universal stress protein n=1 Tax=Aestuariirhabdus haliotis TaxID=2918751 RepID=UPI00201B398C|nr:universal stress protein [Aestuariirhabdus haliotis]MCL6417575.1 universal stress protein [Aestuariirhabdus haliotis]MCL6420599.1 universal stress protein [Aestuariirhabdus haliotis]